MKQVHYTTPEQAGAYLADALDLVNKLLTPDDLREACFTKAVELLSAKQVFVEQSDVGALATATMAIPQQQRH